MAKYLITGYYLRVWVCLTIILAGAADLWAQKNRSKKSTDSRITRMQLQSDLMSFADRYNQFLTQAAITFESLEPDLKARRLSLGTNFVEASAAFEIAASPNSETALLDMVVLVTLQRMVWEDFWQPKVFKKAADVYVETLRRAETDIWRIAAKMLPPSQQKELRELIIEWRRKHPDQWLVSYVRFSEFDESRRKSLERAVKSGGLMAPVKKATEVVDEIRMLGERAMYQLSRMQLLINLQVQMIFLAMIGQPEVENVLNEIPEFSSVSKRFADAVEKLPKQITVERSAAVNQVMTQLTRFRKEALNQLMAHVATERKALIRQTMNRVTGEREATINHLMGRVTTERKAFIQQVLDGVTSEREAMINHFMDRIASERKAAVNQMLEGVANERQNILNGFVSQDKRLAGLLKELRMTLTQGTELATALNSTVTATNTLTARFEKDTPDPSHREDDAGIKDYQALVSEASATVNQLGQFVQDLDKFMGSPSWDQRIPQFVGLVGQMEQKSEEFLNRVFWMGTGLILIFLSGSCLFAIIYRYAGRKISK